MKLSSIGGLIVVLLCATSTAFAIPQFTLLTGNRCSNCHVAETGGGQRTYLGWYSRSDVGVIPPDAGIISWMYPDDATNEYFGKKLLLGTNIRVQSTRSFADASAERATFPMQLSLHGAFRPVKALTVEGSFNFAALRKSPNSDAQIRFPGQRAGSVSAIFRPTFKWPTIRAGLFRPGFGMRYDDHTMFPVNYISGLSRLNYLAPDWAEYGAEVSYEGLRWLTVSTGVFGSEALSRVQLTDGEQFVSAVSGNNPTITARAVAYPRVAEGHGNSYLGGSVLINNDFNMQSLVGGFGVIDAVYLMLDLTRTEKKDIQKSLNFMAEAGWQFIDPIIAYARFEHGTTDQRIAGRSIANSGVFGAQIFLIPYVEIRPEYRLFDTAREGVATRWNVQLHIFY